MHKNGKQLDLLGGSSQLVNAIVTQNLHFERCKTFVFHGFGVQGWLMVSKSPIPRVMGPLPNGPKINGLKNGDDPPRHLGFQSPEL